jgi:phage shock protein PspC (stress-responsive transcriptional regulator)
MKTAQPNLFTRPDTFFGVCQGLGEDLRFHPNILRLAMAGLFFWSPYIGVAVYAALGAVVALLRWLIPNPRAATAPVHAETAPVAEEHYTDEPLPLAA